MTYVENVQAGLDRARERVGPDERVVDVEDLKCVIFSDHHRGRRDRGDDFLRSERAYNAALGYYLEAGYDLFMLGDCEELWSCSPPEVFDSYRYTFELEAEFHRDDRYVRFWGNHDDLWESEEATREFLDPIFPGIDVLEGLQIRLRHRGDFLGRILMVHGHQGATFSDRHRQLAQVVIGQVPRSVQRFFRQSGNTPAHDRDLREKHDLALYSWAEEQEKTILVTGHTHRPVFMSESELGRIRRSLHEARSELAGEPDSRTLRREVAEVRARMEWIKSKRRENGANGVTSRPRQKPCYFNGGCCSFVDGDITGLEISDGQIRLVRWPDRAGEPRPQPLATADLVRDVFSLL